MTSYSPGIALLRQPSGRLEKIAARLCLLLAAAVLCACSKTADL